LKLPAAINIQINFPADDRQRDRTVSDQRILINQVNAPPPPPPQKREEKLY
jgi:hypothetical protein